MSWLHLDKEMYNLLHHKHMCVCDYITPSSMFSVLIALFIKTENVDELELDEWEDRLRPQIDRLQSYHQEETEPPCLNHVLQFG